MQEQVVPYQGSTNQRARSIEFYWKVVVSGNDHEQQRTKPRYNVIRHMHLFHTLFTASGKR